MKRLLAIALISTLTSSAEEGQRSGHATAQWLVAGQQDHILVTVVRLQVDKHWHTYWLNPGEAGMPTSVELKLPEGWEGDALRHPVPKKFKTGGLHGFGHEGTVDYRLFILMPEGFQGDGQMEATVSWLTCNDDSCIPGEVTLKLKVEGGKLLGPKIGEEEKKEIDARFADRVESYEAYSTVKLKLEDGKDHWKLIIDDAQKLKFDPAKTRVFVETQELIPASAEVKFKKDGERWVAEAPKGEFAPQNPDECAILLVQEGKRAMRLEMGR